ncbi:MAG: hypothetical protein M1828_005939 [Chrysothrix sp. TS-e1954]|nr:MAG: hypothetical protein M1828_005939 [Chrysothrix sp. TS-e1954]
MSTGPFERLERLHEEEAYPDPLTISVQSLQKLLENGKLSSVDLADMYMKQIDRHDRNGLHLNAIISKLPREKAHSIARELDAERAIKGSRGPMHGIPIIVKDTICTPSLHMETTCGSFALKGAKASKDARVIDLLVAAGMIVLAKTNLSEWGGYKGCIGGWSAVGEQTQSPYVRGGVLSNATVLGHSTPSGSSSGSAVGVAAGFAPLAIGTETDGSIVQPATRAALYGMKGTLGSIPTDGIQPISAMLDCAGAMAKTPHDLAELMVILQGDQDLKPFLRYAWGDIRVGFVDPDLWQPADSVVEPNEGFRKQTYNEIDIAISKLRDAGAHVVQSIGLIAFADVEKAGGNTISDTMDHDYCASMQAFLGLFDNPNHVKNVEELVKFNSDHTDIEMPPGHGNQDALIGALNSTLTDVEYAQSLRLSREKAVEEVSTALHENKVDAIMGPADARIPSLAAMAGFPVATVPLGYAEFNGRAFGMNIIAESGSEGKILRIMAAWDAIIGPRKPPPMLVEHRSEGTYA